MGSAIRSKGRNFPEGDKDNFFAVYLLINVHGRILFISGTVVSYMDRHPQAEYGAGVSLVILGADAAVFPASEEQQRFAAPDDHQSSIRSNSERTIIPGGNLMSIGFCFAPVFQGSGTVTPDFLYWLAGVKSKHPDNSLCYSCDLSGESGQAVSESLPPERFRGSAPM